MSWNLVAVFLFGGLGAGFLTGLLGVGGGVVMVPLLYQVFLAIGASQKTAFATAVATSLSVMIFTAAYSARIHRRSGLLDGSLLLWLALGTMAGTLLGSHLMVASDDRVLRLSFGIFLWLVAASMYLPPVPARPPGSPPSSRYRFGLVLTGLGVGIVASLFGIGGTTLLVPALMLFFGIAIHQAIATATALIVVTALFGACSYLFIGLHDPAVFAIGRPSLPFLALLLMAPGALFASRFGIRTAQRFSHIHLKTTLVLFQVFVGARFIFGG